MSDLYRALADSTRRAILDELAEHDGQSLFELCSRLAMKRGIHSSRQAISQHLEILEEVGLIITEKQGRCKLHFFDAQPLRAIVDRWPVPSKKEQS
jgi:DNA-binding transcriptional ArsR family regulator